MTTRVRPKIEHHVSPSGHDYGHELVLERVHDYGDRASGLVVGELSITDLACIGATIQEHLRALPIAETNEALRDDLYLWAFVND